MSYQHISTYKSVHTFNLLVQPLQKTFLPFNERFNRSWGQKLSDTFIDTVG